MGAGEPPTSKGYTPSVFTRLARLLERAGQFRVGSITAFYTVLMEGDDQQDPLVDALRALLDGHVVLSRSQAAEGWYPPINLLDSISRLMPVKTQPKHREQAALFRRMMAIYARSEDLVRIGAYKAGSDPDLERALRAHGAMRSFMTQGAGERVRFADSLRSLAELVQEDSGRGYPWRTRPPFRVRELEEEQCGAAVEEAVVQMRRLENAVVAAQERIRRGRLLVAASAQSGDLLDRVAGVEETRSAGRAQENRRQSQGCRKRRWQICGNSLWPSAWSGAR